MSYRMRRSRRRHGRRRLELVLEQRQPDEGQKPEPAWVTVPEKALARLVRRPSVRHDRDAQLLAGYLGRDGEAPRFLPHAVAVRCLADLISRISERRFGTPWEPGVELLVWRALEDPERHGLLPALDPETREDLEALREAAGGWVRWSVDEQRLLFASRGEWARVLADEKPRERVADHAF